MAQKDNILQELKMLNSQLVGAEGNVYVIPEGYFDGLIAQVIKRIKAMEADSAAEELDHLSPLLKSMHKQMPYSVPEGYFDRATEGALAAIRSTHQSVSEELESISPLLSGLKKEMPFTVPQSYFEQLEQKIVTGENKPAKIISLTQRRWFRRLAAAAVIGIVAVTGFLVITRPKGAEKVLVQVKKDVKKMDDTQKESMIEFLDAGLTGEETVQVSNPEKTEEIKTLLEGVSEEELKDLQQQTEDLEDVLSTE